MRYHHKAHPTSPTPVTRQCILLLYHPHSMVHNAAQPLARSSHCLSLWLHCRANAMPTGAHAEEQDGVHNAHMSYVALLRLGLSKTTNPGRHDQASSTPALCAPESSKTRKDEKNKEQAACFSSTRAQVSSTTHPPGGAKLLWATPQLPGCPQHGRYPFPIPSPPSGLALITHITLVKNLAQTRRFTPPLLCHPNKGQLKQEGQ